MNAAASTPDAIHLVVIGNVVEDRADDDRWVPGGPALYAARMAASLGAHVSLFARIPPGYPAAALEGLDLHARHATRACRYANTYDVGGNRTQYLLTPGEALKPPFDLAAPPDALILAPAYHELDGLPDIDARVLAISLQGPLRLAGHHGRIRRHPRPCQQVEPFIQPGAFAFFSEEDTPDPDRLAAHLARYRMTAVVTRGYRGATIFEGTGRRHVDALPAPAVDPTGAGDCFAAAWTVRFAETGDLGAACSFGLAAGSLATEAIGLACVAPREAVSARARGAILAGEAK